MKPYLIYFNKIGSNSLGYISVAEIENQIPFTVKRVYWTYFTPEDVERGNHAHKKLQQIIVAVSGVINFTIIDSKGNKTEFLLDKPYKGLFIPFGFWREIKFSHNAVLLCLASELYDEHDYIREINKFLTL